MAHSDQRAIGFDFGTSTTLLSERVGEALPRTVHIGSGVLPWMPSDVWLDASTGEFVVGEEAEQRTPSSLLIRSVKRALTENRETIRVTQDAVVHEVKVSDVVDAILQGAASRVTRARPDLLSEGKLQIGCPAMWVGNQRRGLVEAASEAGFLVDVDLMLDEPIAAGISWAWEQHLDSGDWPEGDLLIVDFGGGTLDVALLRMDGGSSEVTVLAAEAVGQAGDALDAQIYSDLEGGLARKGTPISKLADPVSAAALLSLRARDLKHLLSDTSGGASRSTPLGGGYGVGLNYGRSQLESAFASGLQLMTMVIEWTLRAAELRKRHSPGEPTSKIAFEELCGEVDHVLLVGGMSHIPSVSERTSALFPQASIHRLGRPQEAVAAGLTLASVFDDLNLHRPAFNVIAVVKKDGREISRKTVYSAFDPLYAPSQVLKGETHLGAESTVQYPRDCFGTTHVSLVFESLGGKPMKIDLGGRTGSPTVPLQRGETVTFKLFTDGRVLLREGAQRYEMVRLERWPVIRSSNYVVKAAPVDPGGRAPIEVGHWWGERG